MHTIILAIVIALAGLVVIAGGALELSTLEAAEGEMLQVSDYLSGIGTVTKQGTLSSAYTESCCQRSAPLLAPQR